MSFPRYPNYKESGVEWLGQVPDHWKVSQIRRTTYLKARVGWKGLTSEEFREQAFAYLVTGSDFRAKFVKWDECYQVEKARYEDDPFIQLRNGDLLITKDGTIGKLAIVSNLERPACLNSGIFVARPRNSYTTEFMYWLLSSTVFSVFCDLESFGSTINHLYQNVFERFAFPAPPESEQLTIADFLDRETAKIDGLIAEQQRLIELLKEKRQAVISHAVTKGLNPDAPMKDSGIEWLGQVPEHWVARPVKYIAKVGNGSTPSREVAEYWGESGFPWLNSSVVNQVEVTEAVGYVTERALRECHLPIVNPPAVLVGITGQGRTRGMASMLRITATLNQHLAYVTPSGSDVEVNYLLRVFEMAYLKLRRDSEEAGATKGAITCEQIGNLRIPLPPITEQKAIDTNLHTELEKYDTLTAEAQKAIDLLQERRSALISAAVTGQIDVRGIQQQEAA